MKCRVNSSNIILEQKFVIQPSAKVYTLLESWSSKYLDFKRSWRLFLIHHFTVPCPEPIGFVVWITGALFTVPHSLCVLRYLTSNCIILYLRYVKSSGFNPIPRLSKDLLYGYAWWRTVHFAQARIELKRDQSPVPIQAFESGQDRATVTPLCVHLNQP